MKTLALMAQKGGAGKTTLAVHLAQAARRERVAVLDLDPQRSAVAWSTVRGVDRAPPVVPCTVAELPTALRAATSDGHGLVILDTPPHATAAARAIAGAADAVLIPCRPDALDIAAAEASVRAVDGHGRAAFVLSACPYRAPEIDEAREALATFGLPVAPVVVHLRRPLARALKHGQAVAEFEPRGKAAAEIAELWAWTREELLA